MTTGKTRRTVEIAEEVPDLQSGHESAAESAAESGARSGAEVESEERIERLRAELGDKEGYVVLCRRNQDTGKLATLAKLNAAAFSVEYVMQRYGGGNYVPSCGGSRAGLPARSSDQRGRSGSPKDLNDASYCTTAVSTSRGKRTAWRSRRPSNRNSRS